MPPELGALCTDEDREALLRKGGFSKSETSKIIETVLSEENRKPESSERVPAAGSSGSASITRAGPESFSWRLWAGE
jgi:hypothetical protein